MAVEDVNVGELLRREASRRLLATYLGDYFNPAGSGGEEDPMPQRALTPAPPQPMNMVQPDDGLQPLRDAAVNNLMPPPPLTPYYAVQDGGGPTNTGGANPNLRNDLYGTEGWDPVTGINLFNPRLARGDMPSPGQGWRLDDYGVPFHRIDYIMTPQGPKIKGEDGYAGDYDLIPLEELRRMGIIS